ncbi:Phytochrome [Drechslerella dactyloides]|uniref:Phytochrome n=1 Tax=Drechslerella dactyloides TaxID=74499 RepID=A0AAD6IV13_DREDA|nr:Phytochrome [Drechslerella dactyloides]
MESSEGDLCARINELLCECAGDDAGAGDSEAKVRKFMPLQSLYKLLTKEEIEKAVTASITRAGGIPFYQEADTVNWILAKGKRIFAILVALEHQEHLIPRFIEHDFETFDEKLPFPLELLNRVVPSIAVSFHGKQWEFVSPVWSKNVIHRELPDEIRLPFTYNKKIDAGGFGDIYEIKLHPDHQVVALLPTGADQRIVRKEFKSALFDRNRSTKDDSASGSSGDNDYTKELRNLSILNELKHPNIIELLTSYTYKNKHNLIFPLVQGGNLGTFFRGDRLEAFQLDETFLTALCGLSSAIEKVHYYTLERLNIDLIGCHYDLKPKNILVSGDAFVLADFGLSKLKGSSEAPKDLYEGGGGDYLAPECEDFTAGFLKNAINQSSDIWSFGCVMAEVLTYMRRGADGVNEFRMKRKVKIGSSRMAAFHAGIGRPNLGLASWLQDLEGDSTIYSRQLVQLIKSMLQLNPDDRPDARQVTARLRYITVQTYYSSVHSLYDNLLKKPPDSFEAYAESRRIKSWGSVFNTLVSELDDGWVSGPLDRIDLVAIYTCLRSVQEELKSTIQRCENTLSPLFGSLRLFGDELFNLLPRDLEMRAKALWEIEMVSSEDLGELLKTVEATGTINKRISTLARIKRMSILAAELNGPTATNLRVDPKFIKKVGPCSSHTHALVRSTLGGPERNVLIEWIHYGDHETSFFEKLVLRIEALAALLHSTKPDDFRILRCSGFVHESVDSAFGLIFDFPKQSGLAPKCLADVIVETSNMRERPTLGTRFQLALNLALSLFGFHKVGWLHKSISPYNVLFFINLRSTRAARWLETPYLTGFNHSRQDDALAFTLGPDSNETISRYYHPEYSQSVRPQIPYRIQFDYYSLGLVLLEIGLWETLEDIIKRRKRKYASKREMLEDLQKARVPLLGHFMGTDYQDAVNACLSGLGDAKVRNPAEAAELQFRFEKEVVERLRRCNA